MKKSAIALPPILAILALFGCGGNSPKDTAQKPDSAPPARVLAIEPVDGDRAVAEQTKVSLKLSAPVDSLSFGPASFILKDGNGRPVKGTATSKGLTARFTPDEALDAGQTYTFGFGGGVRDMQGHAFASFASAFLVASPPPTEGPDPLPAIIGPVINDMFLQGRYVEMGISLNGYFGTTAPAPTGYHPMRSGRKMSIVTDYDQNGWDVGTPPQSGDFFLPGSPEQGFTIQFGPARYTNNGNNPKNDITPLSLVDTSTPNLLSAVWTGSINGLSVQRTVSLKPNDFSIKVDMVLTNNTGLPVQGVWFLENGDPDQGKDIGFDYDTWNYITQQPGYAGNADQAWVYSYPDGGGGVGPERSDILMGLGTKDNRARVHRGGFSNRDPIQFWNDNQAPNPNAKIYEDNATSLVYNLGDMAAGASTQFSFTYTFSQYDMVFTDFAGGSRLKINSSNGNYVWEFLSGGVLVNSYSGTGAVTITPTSIYLTDGTTLTLSSSRTRSFSRATYVAPDGVYTLVDVVSRY